MEEEEEESVSELGPRSQMQTQDSGQALRAALRTTCIWNHPVYLCAMCLPTLCPAMRHPLPTSPSKK